MKVQRKLTCFEPSHKYKVLQVTYNPNTMVESLIYFKRYLENILFV